MPVTVMVIGTHMVFIGKIYRAFSLLILLVKVNGTLRKPKSSASNPNGNNIALLIFAAVHHFRYSRLSDLSD